MEPSSPASRCPSCGAELPKERGATCPRCHAPLKSPFAVDEDAPVPKDPFAPAIPAADLGGKEPGEGAVGPPLILGDDEDAGFQNPFLLGEESAPAVPAAPLAAEAAPPPLESPVASFASPIQPPAPFSEGTAASHEPFVLGEELAPDTPVAAQAPNAHGQDEHSTGERAILMGSDESPAPAEAGASSIPFDTGYEPDEVDHPPLLLGDDSAGSAPQPAQSAERAENESAPAPLNLGEPSSDTDTAPWMAAGAAAHDSPSEIETPFAPPVGSGVIEPPAASLTDAINQSALDHAPLEEGAFGRPPAAQTPLDEAPAAQAAIETPERNTAPPAEPAPAGGLPWNTAPPTEPAPVGGLPWDTAPPAEPAPAGGLPWDTAAAPENLRAGVEEPRPQEEPITGTPLEEIAASAPSIGGAALMETAPSIDAVPPIGAARPVEATPAVGFAASSPTEPTEAAPPMGVGETAAAPPLSATEPEDLFDLGTEPTVVKTDSEASAVAEAGPSAPASQPWETTPSTPAPSAGEAGVSGAATPAPPWEIAGAAAATRPVGPGAAVPPEPYPAAGRGKGPRPGIPVIWIIVLAVIGIALAVFFFLRLRHGAPITGATGNQPAAVANGVQVYWRFATSDYRAQHRGIRLPALPGRTPELVRVDVENHTNKPLRLKPGWFIVKAVGKTFAPRPNGAPGLMSGTTISPSKNMPGWLLYEMPRAALKPGAISLVYKGPSEVTISHSKNGQDKF